MSILGVFHTVALVAAVVASVQAQAQTGQSERYPQRPISLIVGYSAGAGADVIARIVSKKLSERLGQPVVVENRTGAAGIIGAEYVAKAKPDGYTLLFAASSMFTTNPIMYKTMPYSAGSFVPISTVVNFPFFLLINAQQPIKSVQELRDYLSAKPDRASCGGAAGVHQLACALFKSKTGNVGEFIPYRGINEAINAVMAGDLQMSMANAGPADTAISSGKVRALAVTTGKRLAEYPDIPTFAEAGLPGMEIQSWFGLMAPAGTPMPIVRRLQQELHQMVDTNDFQQFVTQIHLIPQKDTSEQFAAMIAADLARWRAVAKANNIEPSN